MRFPQPLKTAMVAVAASVLFVAIRWSLLYGDGALEGTNVDSSILALMGKQFHEGRGFEIFTWGVRHLGTLTPAITALWAFPLKALGVEWVWPLAGRYAALTEVALGVFFISWAVARIDRRAGAVVALVLAMGPPELYKLSLYPLAHEMAFFVGAIIFAIVTQHLTAPPGKGWLSSHLGRLLFGVVLGFGWWMNRTVFYAIAGALIVFTLRSDFFRRVWSPTFWKDRVLFRPPAGQPRLPGLVEAACFVLQWTGVALILIYIVCDFYGFPTLNFVIGPMLDGIFLILGAQLLALAVRPPKEMLREVFRFTPEARAELRNVLTVAAGFFIGFMPSLLARVLDWYPKAYEIGFRFRMPADLRYDFKVHGPHILPNLLGTGNTPAGWVYSIAIIALVIGLVVHYRKDIAAYFRLTPGEWGARAYFASICLTCFVLTVLMFNTLRTRYWTTVFGPLFALLALEGFRWWDTRRRDARAFVTVALGACLISVATAAIFARVMFYKPDHRVILQRVEALQCKVCYVSVYNSYDFRMLTTEKIGFISYAAHDFTPDDTIRYRTWKGQRCYITREGSVFPIDGDLQLKGRNRFMPTKEHYIATKRAAAAASTTTGTVH